MQIVIDIPEEAYAHLLQTQKFPEGFDIMHRLIHGTPLPKGHGDLKDADEVMKVMERNLDMQDLYLPIHFKQFALDEAQTIIEADKEGEEPWEG